MKTLGDYMRSATLFPRLSGVSHIVPIAGYLDTLLQLKYGLRDLGRIVRHYEVDGAVDDAGQTNIANLVYLTHKEKWDKLFEYIDAEIVPWTTGSSLTEVTYGKVVEDAFGGSDSTSRADLISGFDSVIPVDDKSRDTLNTYGKTETSEQSGVDSIEVTTRTGQADILVDYTMQFWGKWGLFDTILRDTARMLSLPLYNLERW